jgi:hypothetical protein
LALARREYGLRVGRPVLTDHSAGTTARVPQPSRWYATSPRHLPPYGGPTGTPGDFGPINGDTPGKFGPIN